MWGHRLFASLCYYSQAYPKRHNRESGGSCRQHFTGLECLSHSGPLARSSFYRNKEDIERTKGTGLSAWKHRTLRVSCERVTDCTWSVLPVNVPVPSSGSGRNKTRMKNWILEKVNIMDTKSSFLLTRVFKEPG